MTRLYFIPSSADDLNSLQEGFFDKLGAAAKEFCRRGIVLDKGKIILDGEIEESIGFYERQK